MHDDFFSTVSEIVKYGGATFAALVAMSIYTMTDGFFVGNWVGTDALEAMALIFPVTMIFSAIGVLFETGGSAVVSEKIGAGKKNLSEKIMRTNYFCAIVLGIFIAIVGNFFIEDFLKILSDNPDDIFIIDMAISFLRITLCGVPFLLVINLTGAFMRCVDRPGHVFFLVGSSALSNIILDTLFIIVFGWGLRGAALATMLAQIFGAAIAFWYFKFSRQKFSSPLSFSGLGHIFQEFKIGAGFAVATVMMSFIEYFINATILQYDAADLLATVTISNIILSFVFLPLNGLDTGIQPLVSRLYAAHQEQHCLRVMRYGFFLTCVLTLAIYVVLMIFTEELIKIFIAGDETITPDMIVFLRAMFLLQPFVGLYTWLSGIMAALEDEWRNLVISLVPLFVQVPLIWFLPKILPIEYLALNYSINDVAEALLAFILIRSLLKEKNLSFKKIFHSR